MDISIHVWEKSKHVSFQVNDGGVNQSFSGKDIDSVVNKLPVDVAESIIELAGKLYHSIDIKLSNRWEPETGYALKG